MDCFYWQDDVRAVMERTLEVYVTKDEQKNLQRRRRKEEVIAWTLSELEKGW